MLDKPVTQGFMLGLVAAIAAAILVGFLIQREVAKNNRIKQEERDAAARVLNDQVESEIRSHTQ